MSTAPGEDGRSCGHVTQEVLAEIMHVRGQGLTAALDDERSIGELLDLVDEQLNLAERADSERDGPAVRSQLVKVAAAAIMAVTSLDRQPRTYLDDVAGETVK